MNENYPLTIEEARRIASSVVEKMLRRAFDPTRMDDCSGAEAAKFVFRVRREGMLVARLDDEEHAVSPAAMLDPAVVDAAEAVLVPPDEICSLVARKMHAMSSELAENVKRGLSGRATAESRLIAGCSCCHQAVPAL